MLLIGVGRTTAKIKRCSKHLQLLNLESTTNYESHCVSYKVLRTQPKVRELHSHEVNCTLWLPTCILGIVSWLVTGLV